MPDDKPQIPPPRFAVREFTTPNYADGFFTETFKRSDPAYMAVRAPKRGALYSSIVGGNLQVAAQFPNLYFLKESRLGTSHEWVVWIWATDPSAEDTYNSAVEHTSAVFGYPEFSRVYDIRRDVYNSNPTPLSIGSALLVLIGVGVNSGGTQYSSATTLQFSGGGGSGATGFPVISGGVIISVIVTNSGNGYTTAPSVTAVDSSGSGASFTSIRQSSSATLVDQKKQEFPDENPLRNEYVRVVRKFETLPGPNITEVKTNQETGLPILESVQKVAQATALLTYPCGDFLPPSLAVQSIASGVPASVQLTSGLIELPVGAWVVFSGTSSTPNINGIPVQIASLSTGPSGLGQGFTFNPPNPITAGGLGGTVQSANWISRDLRATENGNVMEKVETVLALPSANPELIDTYFNFPYQNFIEAFKFYTSVSYSTDITSGNGFLTSNSVDGMVDAPEQVGFRGQSNARRQRFFFSGPPTLAFRNTWPPTKIIPSEGEAVIRGFAQSGSIFPTGGGGGQSFSQSYHYSKEHFGPALTGPSPALVPTGGTGQFGPFTIASVSISTPDEPDITLTAAHGMAQTGGSVTIIGSTTTPSIDGSWTVLSIPTSTSFQIQTQVNLTSAGSGGGQVNVGATATAVLDIPTSVPPMMVSTLAIAGITTSATPIVTTTGGVTSGVHYLQVGQYVYLDNTGTSPSLDKQYWKVTAVTSTTFTIAPGLGTITGSSGVGTIQECVTIAEEPRRLGTAAMWEVIVWLVQILYTSGQSS
jgi:hypothetical protein